MKFHTEDGEVEFRPRRVIIAGWTGRDAGAVTHHIEELAALGVPGPSQTPLYYRVDRSLATQDESIQVLGPDSSGEAEPVLFRSLGRLWLSLGSDHTDRGLEAVSVAQAKQACAKPVAREAWSLDHPEDTDRLILRSWISGPGERTLYQDGALSAILPLPTLIAGGGLEEGDLMFCGTLPAIGGVRPADRFEMALIDPDRDREIRAAYDIHPLPVIA